MILFFYCLLYLDIYTNKPGPSDAPPTSLSAAGTAVKSLTASGEVKSYFIGIELFSRTYPGSILSFIVS